MNPFNRLRKFWIALAAIISVTAVCVTGKIGGDAYVALITAIVGMFGAHNVASKGRQ